MVQLTDFGRTVKYALIDKGMSQKELATQIAGKTGLFCDHGYVYKILTGRRYAPKIVAAIREILDIPAA